MSKFLSLYDKAQDYIKALTIFIEKEAWLHRAEIQRFNTLWASYKAQREEYKKFHPGKPLFRRSLHRQQLKASIEALKGILVDYEKLKTDSVLMLRQLEEEHVDELRMMWGPTSLFLPNLRMIPVLDKQCYAARKEWIVLRRSQLNLLRVKLGHGMALASVLSL
ncbi:hypothetical protein FRC03_000237 [Tulasnella sp. 419]|nr:hypothetical protein FRC02_000836 [Tulasnella sp. 418]KAG8949812.1 hypothetical protein FRC03_000237 [Tulasnella sp. 419]